MRKVTRPRPNWPFKEDRLITRDDDLRKLPGDLREFGPLSEELDSEFAQRLNNAMLDIKLTLQGQTRYSLIKLVDELSTNPASRQLIRIALSHHWKAENITFWLRERREIESASEIDEEAACEDGGVMRRFIVVCPVVARMEAWTHGKAPTDGGESKYLGIVLNEVEREASRLPMDELGPVEFGKKCIPWRLLHILVAAGDEGIHRNKIEAKIPRSLDQHKKTLNAVIEPLKLVVDSTRGIWRLIHLGPEENLTEADFRKE